MFIPTLYRFLLKVRPLSFIRLFVAAPLPCAINFIAMMHKHLIFLSQSRFKLHPMQQFTHRSLPGFPNPVYLPAVAFVFWFSLWPGIFPSNPLLIRESEPVSSPLEVVQFAIPGNFMAPFENLNNIPEGGIDLDEDGIKDIIPVCSCRNLPIVTDGTNPNSGYFNDQLVVATGVSGQQWRVTYSEDVFLRNSLLSVPRWNCA